MSDFTTMFPRSIWEHQTDDFCLMLQLLVIQEEVGEASEAMRKDFGDEAMAMEVADVMIAASGLLHRLGKRLHTSPDVLLARAHKKNRDRGYYAPPERCLGRGWECEECEVEDCPNDAPAESLCDSTEPTGVK